MTGILVLVGNENITPYCCFIGNEPYYKAIKLINCTYNKYNKYL